MSKEPWQPVRYDDDLRPRDWRGRIVPHQLGAVQMLASITGGLAAFKSIPDEFWGRDDDNDVQIAVVSCPCGETPQVELNKLTQCLCHRFFAYTGRSVMCANRPGQWAEEPVPVLDSD